MRHRRIFSDRATLERRIVGCRRCPRLRTHCRQVAATRRAAYADCAYWGRPVPDFGDAGARLLIVGLAPGAHGANRTGRMFTGDRSGDFLFRVMHRAGLASQPTATAADDGLHLRDAMITAAAHCAPPANRPTADELARCAPFLDATFDLLPRLRVVLCLGGLALGSVAALYQRRGWILKRSELRFGHGSESHVEGAPAVLCAYHPSQQNTFTGRLTEPMLLAVFERAREMGGHEGTEARRGEAGRARRV